MTRIVVLAVAAGLAAQAPDPVPVRGLTAGPAVARAYDTILDADFTALPAHLASTCGPAPPAACHMLAALALWWQIALDPESRRLDQPFSTTVDAAIAAGTEWIALEPSRAEAWFYLGAAYGARVQWRVLRHERLAAARDGKRVKETLEHALALDPGLHDAKFGVGLYRYYADVAPAALRLLRWLLFLPGGDRAAGLRQILDARDHGQLVRGEADYQLHLIYLWYEKRFGDALGLIKGLQRRYPHNPLFYQIEAEIQDVYFHDAAASLAASSTLLTLAERNRVHEPALASVGARLNMAVQFDRLGHPARARDLLNILIAERPARPDGATRRAQELLKTIAARTRE